MLLADYYKTCAFKMISQFTLIKGNHKHYTEHNIQSIKTLQSRHIFALDKNQCCFSISYIA